MILCLFIKWFENRKTLTLLWGMCLVISAYSQKDGIAPKDTLHPFQLTDQGHQWADSGRYDSSTYYYGAAADAYADLLNRQDDSLIWVRYYNCQLWIGANDRIEGKLDSALDTWKTCLKNST